MKEYKRSFTLIELLVVISIIGLLGSIVFVNLGGARAKARNAKSIADAKQIQTALEMYYADNGKYPNAPSWRSECNTWGLYSPQDVIPGLMPEYLSTFPEDPSMDKPNSKCCFLYASANSGKDYKLLIRHSCLDANYNDYPSFIDPRRDGGDDFCKIDGTRIWSWAIYTPGGCSL